MAQITMDKKALAILGLILAFLGLALYAAGLFSGMLMREAVSRPDAATLERQLADVNAKLAEAARREPAPAPAPAPAPEPAPVPAPAPAPAKAEPAPPPQIPPPPVLAKPAGGQGYVVQTGAFTVKMNALNQAERLKEKGHNPAVVEVKGKSDRVWFVVRLLGYASMDEARQAADTLLERDGIKAVAMEADFPMSPLHEDLATAETAAAEAAEATPAPGKRRLAPPAQPAPPPSGVTRHSVQVSSFRDEKDADTTVRMLKNQGFTPCTVLLYDSQDKPWYVVQIGDFASRDEASQAGKAFAASGGSFVIKSYDDTFLAQRRRCP